MTLKGLRLLAAIAAIANIYGIALCFLRFSV